ncbi:MAG: hypothetical protein ABSC17_00570, partial [Thermacetogeniaceae bacterium]
MRLGIVLPEGLVDLIKELLFPQVPGCPLCGRPGSPRHLCRACLISWSELTRNLQICKLCGRFSGCLGPDGVCRACRQEAPPFVFARGVAPYEGLVRDALYRYKFTAGRELAGPLGE